MADLRISELSALAGSNLAGVDELAIVDDSASETKKITVADLIANGVTVISDDTIPGAKILFGSGDIATAALADSAVTTAKVADDVITAAKLADESTVDLVTTLPASGAFAGQLALDTDDNNLYAWDGSAWRSIAAPGSVGNINGSTTGEINIVATTSGTSVTISATIDDTTSAAQFLAGPTGSAGAVGYRTIVGSDLPTATTSAKGGVIVNGNGLTLSGDTLEIDNSVTSSATHHVVTYDANGLITGGRAITSADLPAATTTALGGVIVSDGLTVDVAGNLSIDNSVTSGTYTKVTVTAEGLVSGVDNLGADDIPDHSAAKLTSGTIGTSLIANDAITADKIADQSTTKFGGAAGSDNVTIFPTGDFQGQFFYDETTQDLYIYTGSSFVPITVLSGNLVNAGAYNANTNQMSSVTSAGSSAGFSVGAALPAPAQTNLNHYVVVDTSGTGTGAAPAVALAPPDMLLSQGVGTEYSLIDVSNAIAGQTASNISFIASGNIIATDVQAALQEVDTEKIAKAGDTMTGALGIGTASSIVFEGSTADDYETTLTVTDPTADRTITFPDVTGNAVTTGDTGTVTSTMILDGTIVNADINASAEIAVSKLADGAAYQILHTDSSGTGVEWTSNLDIPGTLDVTSTATFDSTVTVTGLITANGKVSFPAGTAAAPGLYSGTDIDTGIYAPGANEFGVATGGTSRLVIDSSGNVGIGTLVPSSVLDVQGSGATIQVAATGQTNARLRIQAGNTSESFLEFGDTDDSDVGEIVYDHANNFMRFNTNASERMRLDSSGRLGIGISSDLSSKLQVENSYIQVGQSSNTSQENILIQSYGYRVSTLKYGRASIRSSYINTDNTADLRFYTGTGSTSTGEKMRIDSSGRVGIGETSMDALLVIKGNSDASTTPSIRLKDGSDTREAWITNASGDLSLNVGGDDNVAHATLKMFESGIFDYAQSTGSVLRIDSSGRLLVGTSSDTSAARFIVQGLSSDVNAQGVLDIRRGTRPSVTDTEIGSVRFKAVAGDGRYAQISAYSDGASGSDSDTPGSLRFSTTPDGSSGATERMRIDSSGNVGIGVTSVSSNLHINPASDGTFSNGLRVQRYSTPSQYGVFNYSGGALNIVATDIAGSTPVTRFFRSTNGTTTTESMRIDSSGNVGIGLSTTSPLVSNPWTNLQVNGANVASPVAARASGTPASNLHVSTNSYGADQGGSISLGSQPDNVNNYAAYASIAGRRDSSLGYVYSGYLQFNTSDGSNLNERMRIDSSGRLLVGTSSVVSSNDIAAFKKSGSSVVSVQTSTDTNNTQAYFGAENSNGTQNAQIGVIKRNNNDMVGYIRLDEEDGVGQFLWVDNAGNFRISTDSNHCGTTSGTVVGTQTSDERLKNIGDVVSYGLSEIKQLQPKQYTLKTEPDTNKLGFIAQEVESIIPEAVFDTKEELENHQEGDRTKLGMEYVQLIPVLVNAVKELSAENDALKQRLTDAGL